MSKAKELKHAVQTAERSGVGRALPVAVRERVVVYTAERRRDGASWRAIAADVGVSEVTLARWAGARPSRAVVPFRAVHVASTPPEPRLVVHGPGGVRVEGLTLADAAELLRRLA